MKKALLLTTLVGLLPLGSFAQQGDSHQQEALVFTHVTVIDATGAPAKPDMTVLIKGGRIAAIGKSAKLDVPENAQVVDATGKFVIPGLWDMHVHPWLGKNYLALFTANGVTGVRVMWGEPKHHKWREEISAGKLIGPRMVIASPTIDGPNPLRSGSIVVSNEDEGRQVVRKVKKEGADLVKVYQFIPRDVYLAIADEAKKQGMSFAGHVPSSVGAVEASDAGQHSLEHCLDVMVACSKSGEEEFWRKFLEARRIGGPVDIFRLLSDITYDQQKAAELFSCLVKNDTWVCPTLSVLNEPSCRDKESLTKDPRLKYMPLFIRERWNPKNNAIVAVVTGEAQADCKRYFQKGLDIVGTMRLAGVKLLAGTDTAMPYCIPGFGLHDELALLVQAGLSPMEALQTATYNPAKFLGRLDSLGTIEQGKTADLVLLEANPLQDITNTHKIAAVVCRGRIFDKRSLQKMFAQIETSHLHKAAAEGKIEHVKLLIAEGADVNARDQQGWTPALAALDRWEMSVTDLLLEKGADITTPHLAAYTGNLIGIRSLLEKDAPVDSLGGLTLLHAAAAGGHTDVVEFLIFRGFEATASTENGSTPLHFAALGNHQKAAEILIKNGAPVDSGEATPIVAAAHAGHKTMIELLLSKGANINKGPEPPLYQAVDWGPLDMAKLLLEAGADINARNEEGNTPLHGAARYGRLEMAELLISKGADVNAKNTRGDSPLSMAEKQGHNEIVELFHTHGAKE